MSCDIYCDIWDNVPVNLTADQDADVWSYTIFGLGFRPCPVTLIILPNTMPVIHVSSMLLSTYPPAPIKSILNNSCLLDNLPRPSEPIKLSTGVMAFLIMKEDLYCDPRSWPYRPTGHLSYWRVTTMFFSIFLTNRLRLSALFVFYSANDTSCSFFLWSSLGGVGWWTMMRRKLGGRGF